MKIQFVMALAFVAMPLLTLPVSAAQNLDEAVAAAQTLIAEDAGLRQRMLNSHLHDAVSRADDAEIRRLIALGANPNANDGFTWTPLVNAVFTHGFTPIMETLVSLGAEVDFKGICGKTALHQAASYGRLEAAKFLLARHAEVDSRTCAGQTPLLAAADKDHVELAALLIRNGADLNAKDSDGRSPLFLASRFRFTGSFKMAELLIADPRIDVNVVDKDGMTPLKLAATSNNIELVKRLLLVPGIDLNNNAGGVTALFLADLKNFKDVAVLLRAAGAISLAMN